MTNREPEPCDEDEHKFPPEFYHLAWDDSSANDWCCMHCGWSRRDIKTVSPTCSWLAVFRPVCCGTGHVQRCLRANGHDGPHGGSDYGPFFDPSSPHVHVAP